jgi:hypothetical protein
MNRNDRLELLFKLTAEASLLQDVSNSLKQKGFEPNKPTFSGQIKIPAVMGGVSVTVPDNPIINNKYNVFFQIRSGNSPTKADINTIIVEAEAGGAASKENTEKFGNSDWIKKQLKIIQDELSKKFGNVSLGKLGLGSFSGGYEAVGKIISDPEMKSKIDSLIVLDGIHEGARGNPDPARMKKWVDFAEAAKNDPNKKFVFAYTAVDPGSYASTSDSAYYITDKLNIQRAKQEGKEYKGIKPASIQLYERKSDQPGYGYSYDLKNKPGSSGHQHVMAAKILPEIWNEYLKDWNQ